MKRIEANSEGIIDSRNKDVDICVFVEGTYPYVTGGVSSWLHQLISHLPEFDFAIFHLGSKPEAGRTFKYKLPANVVGFHEIFLGNPSTPHGPGRPALPAKEWEALKKFHEALGDEQLQDAIGILRENF